MSESNETARSTEVNGGRRWGRILIAAVWTATLLLVGALVLEGYLKYKSDRRRSRQEVTPTPVYSRLFDAYQPFAVQHINPFYLFFFPFDTGRRLAMNNDVCSVDVDGFRGDGPAKANGRKLAFLLGGSAAFGHFSTSDSTTIPGQLNQLQDEYLVVNAGVPSWNSYQELSRLANQILDHSPELVIVYDGGNDAALAYDYWQMGLDYPAGTPESFEKLYALVGDIRGARPKLPRKPLYERFFPRLTRSFRFRVFGERPSSTPKLASRVNVTPPFSIVEASARRYLANLRHMQAMTHASGGRFIAVLQPFGNLHDSAPPHRKSHPITPFLREFRNQVFSGPTGIREHLDYSTLLDSLGAEAIWRGGAAHPDIDEDVIFIDGLHLSDPGNRYVAARIVEHLKEATGANSP